MNRKAFVILAVWGAIVSSAGLATAGGLINHFTCYKIKDTMPRGVATKTLLDLTPAGTVIETGCQVKLPPKLACMPTAKDGIPPYGVVFQTNPVLCYKLKCPKQPQPSWTLMDQFGTHTVTPRVVKTLCAPACQVTGSSCNSNDTCCSGTCSGGTCM